MTWGTVSIGGLSFRETITAQESGGKLTITGQESDPPQTADAVHATHLNILGLQGSVVSVTFTDKTELDGFYLVTDAQSDLLNHAGGSVLACTWQLGVSRLGTERDVEFESRMSLVARSTEVAGAPAAVFWQAPPAGYVDYWTGSVVPSGTVSRVSADGTLPVFTGLPAGVYPRWTVGAADYMRGSARVLLDGQRRVGADTPAASAWEISNGLVQVTGGSAGPSFAVAVWKSGVGWVSAKTYTPIVNGSPVTQAPTVTIIRNGPELVILRLSYPSAPGRLTVDLLLRRGARIVAGTLKRQAAATLGITRTAAEAASVVTGGLRATSADADGNRFVLGSSRAVTATTGTASIAKSSTLAFDFFIGHEYGSSPASGDGFADLLGQYLGMVGEQVRAVRR